MFATLSDRLSATFKNLRGKGKLSEADVDATIREIRRALLDADVALPVVRQFAKSIRERAIGEEVAEALNPAQQVVKIVNEELIKILGGETRQLNMAKTGPTVIMLAGLQGAGKTTFAGKLSHMLREQGRRPLLAACDLQRPNAVTQLTIVGEGAGVDVFAPHPGASSEGENLGAGPGDPVQVARDAVAEAERQGYDVLIVDTAGRLGIDEELMQQASDIRAAINPNEVLFVIDAMIGQDAVTTAEAFDKGVDLTGVVLSKLDGDARGGAALSVATVTGKPIMYASVGEKVTDLELFHPDRMASRILDMGDILTLIEQAEKAFDEKETADLASRIAEGDDFTLQDFLTQMQSVRKMGSLKKMLGMLPGMGELRDQIEQFDEREIDRVEAIIHSMTPRERERPKIIDGSRRRRIAKGCGRSVQDVNQLLDRFKDAQKMMSMMRKQGGLPGMGGGKKGKRGKPDMAALQQMQEEMGMGGPGGMPGMPGAGMPGMPGMGMPGAGSAAGKGKAKKKGNKKGSKKGRSGNPARRAVGMKSVSAEEERVAKQGTAFGPPAGKPVDEDALGKTFGNFFGEDKE